MSDPTNARDLFRAAYENRYTWDTNFPGFNADLEVKQGNEVYNTQIRINSDLSVEVSGIENQEVQKSISTQLKDVVTHRQRAAFEQVHGKNNFTIGETDSAEAVEILVSGAAMGSRYKIRDNEICHVNRVVGAMTFVIDTHESLKTGEGYVPTRYDAVFHNTEGEVVQQVQFEDSYEKIGDYYLMTHQILHSQKQGEQTVTSFSYSNVKLLEPVAV